MNLESEIEKILFNIGKEIQIHSLNDGNFVLDINYNKYVSELIDIFNKYLNDQA